MEMMTVTQARERYPAEFEHIQRRAKELEETLDVEVSFMFAMLSHRGEHALLMISKLSEEVGCDEVGYTRQYLLKANIASRPDDAQIH